MFECFHNPPNSDMNYKIFNVRTDVNACDCTRGCTDTVKESALKVDSGRKIPCRTGESNLPQRRAGPTRYQLRYIPTNKSLDFLKRLYCPIGISPVTLSQWGAADAEIKVPSVENTELKGSPFKTWSRSIYSHTCYAHCQGFLPLFRSIHLHIF